MVLRACRPLVLGLTLRSNTAMGRTQVQCHWRPRRQRSLPVAGVERSAGTSSPASPRGRTVTAAAAGASGTSLSGRGVCPGQWHPHRPHTAVTRTVPVTGSSLRLGTGRAPVGPGTAAAARGRAAASCQHGPQAPDPQLSVNLNFPTRSQELELEDSHGRPVPPH